LSADPASALASPTTIGDAEMLESINMKFKIVHHREHGTKVFHIVFLWS
jgi:hypothetical protein